MQLTGRIGKVPVVVRDDQLARLLKVCTLFTVFCTYESVENTVNFETCLSVFWPLERFWPLECFLLFWSVLFVNMVTRAGK